MEYTKRRLAVRITNEAVFTLLAVAGAVLLPQIFHAAGLLFGIGGQLGQIFLPMYLPVLLVGFYRGPIVGAAAGLLSPLVSFAITGMPAVGLLWYIALELMALGALAGTFAKVRLTAPLKVLAVQVLARTIRMAVFALVVGAIGGGALTATAITGGVAQAIPGYVLQLVIVSLLLLKKDTQSNV